MLVVMILLLFIAFVITYHIIVSQERWDYMTRAIRYSHMYSHNHYHNYQHPRSTQSNAPKSNCCNKQNDSLMLLVLMLLNSKYNDNPNIANGNCVQNVMANAIPSITSTLKSRGIDMNNIDYNSSNIKQIVDDVVSKTIRTGVCSGMQVPPAPAVCNDPKVTVRRT